MTNAALLKQVLSCIVKHAMRLPGRQPKKVHAVTQHAFIEAPPAMGQSATLIVPETLTHGRTQAGGLPAAVRAVPEHAAAWALPSMGQVAA